MASDYALRNIRAMDTNGLKSARSRLKVGQAVIAERLGVSIPQVSRWENGKDNVPSSRLHAFARAYEADLTELFGDDADKPPFGQFAAEAARAIPILGEVPGGNWKEAIKNPQGYTYAPGADAPPEAYALKVDGDSMDLHVPNGFTIIIDPTDTDLYAERLFVIQRDGGDVTFKEYMDNPARLVPCSSNPEHREIPVGGGGFTILGRVIWSGKRL